MLKKCTLLWREAHFQVQMYKTPHVRTTFGSWDVEIMHAVVARSTFPSPNVQNTSRSDHFWKLRCRKSARRCGAKQISKSKCTKHLMFGPFLEVEMSKKCTSCWREAHFEVKNVQNTSRSDHFWKLRCRKSAPRCGAKQISKSKCTKHLTFGPLLEVEMSKKCTRLWREANFQVQMYKTPDVRTIFGSWDVEKVYAVLARSTFRSQECKKTDGSEHFWKLRCRKSARRCGAKHISKSKVQTEGFRALLEVVSKKCTPLWREAHFEVKSANNWRVRSTFGRSDVVFRGRRWGLCTWSKVSKRWRFCSISKNDGRRGTFQEDLGRCISRGRRNTRDMCIRDVRRSARWFPERGCILEQQIFGFGKMILRDRCSPSYDLASLCRGRHNTLDRWSGKIAKRIGTRLSALHSTVVNCPFLKESWKIEEVSQKGFVFDVVSF